jgi:hypothetical protein
VNKILFISVLFWLPTVFGAVNIELRFGKEEIQQGSLETATALLSGDSVQKLNLQKLKGLSIGEALYLHQISPLLRKDGSNSFESDFKVIFVKIPEQSYLVQKIDAEEVHIKWMPVKISPVEVPEKLIFEQFEIPRPIEILKWIISALAVTSIILIGLKFNQARTQKKQLRNKKNLLKDSVLSAKSYEEVVQVWKNKSEILSVFPALTSAFKQLETTLFQVQFRPYQTEEDKNNVLKAYQEFKESVHGGFDGV